MNKSACRMELKLNSSCFIWTLGQTGLTAKEKVVCKGSREQEGREWRSEGYCPGNSWRALVSLCVCVCVCCVCTQESCLTLLLTRACCRAEANFLTAQRMTHRNECLVLARCVCVRECVPQWVCPGDVGLRGRDLASARGVALSHSVRDVVGPTGRT